jgi:hypothetical protein
MTLDTAAQRSTAPATHAPANMSHAPLGQSASDVHATQRPSETRQSGVGDAHAPADRHPPSATGGSTQVLVSSSQTSPSAHPSQGRLVTEDPRHPTVTETKKREMRSEAVRNTMGLHEGRPKRQKPYRIRPASATLTPVFQEGDPMELELTGFGEFEGVELLQKLHLFQKLTFDETTRLGSIIQYVDLPPDTIVIEENALGDALYVIAKGEVRVTRDANQDGTHSHAEEIGRLKEGDLFGEMSLIDDLLTSARVTTLEALLAGDDKLAVKVFRSFCRTLSDRLRRTTSMLAKTQAMQVSMR